MLLQGQNNVAVVYNNYKMLMYAGQSYLKPFIEHFKKTKCLSVPNCIISENPLGMSGSHAVIFNDMHLPVNHQTNLTGNYGYFTAWKLCTLFINPINCGMTSSN